ncbi:IS1182 family transposase [Sulfuriferula thiophila]|uniref:IS1182 family transposase n=1 Tax=Sulfuriferula thiophila TaxID=1781211 RepID=UPI000F60750D|nr:IS1182 family transposase [Sulfuriferula thiophila]
MARYKHIDTSPRFLAVDLQRQLLPGTFEYALNRLLDHELDLSSFDARFCNDETGAAAYPPAMLLKIVLFAYSQGIISSRNIERACREHVTFIALSGDSQPHFTTIAGFVSSLGDDITRIFTQILFICDKQGLIGREMFAIDGVKLPSNASKTRSGTRTDFERQVAKLEAAAKVMLERHREADQCAIEPDLRAKETQRITRLQRDAAEIRSWLTHHPEDRKGSKGAIRKSNRTDNESAKMATSKGVIQGYTGVAAVDAKHQIIVEAQAHGTGSEQELLIPVVKSIQSTQINHSLITDTSLITADAGYHSETNLRQLADMHVDALIADNNMRSRDARFAGQGKYKTNPDPLHDKTGKAKPAVRYQPKDFDYDPDTGTCICPAGKQLYGNGSGCTINGYAAVKFQGAQRDCVPCMQRERCLLTPHKTKTRQVSFFRGKRDGVSYTDKMKARIDSPEGRARYGRRFATVEPVFGNLRHNKQLNRFTLRGQKKVDAQWKLFCLVHNIEKLAHHGYAQ